MMLFRKISDKIESHLRSDSNKVLVVDGARQIGKTYIIRYVGKKIFKNFIEINLLEDSLGDRLFTDVRTVSDFYFRLSAIAGEKMNTKDDTLIFLDEIQTCPQLLTMLKFLNNDGKFTYISSGSLLGITLSETSSIPIGSIEVLRMYPLDFEEFLIASGFGSEAIDGLKERFARRESLDKNMHDKMMLLFKKYLLVGGLPDAVNMFLAENNIVKIRKIQSDIHRFYAADAAKYEDSKRLKIRRVFEMIPSNMENKKKRVVFKDIDGTKSTGSRYTEEFDYLVNAGVALEVKAVSTPVFPLSASSTKNLLKLYLNDVGILTSILYRNNVSAVLDDDNSVNLGSVYECAVACELKAHGFDLYYYDNRKKGEVDFLIDDYDELSVLPIEVKSGKDYNVHSALNGFLSNPDYHVKKGYIFSNERLIKENSGKIYLPIYYAAFIHPMSAD